MRAITPLFLAICLCLFPSMIPWAASAPSTDEANVPSKATNAPDSASSPADGPRSIQDSPSTKGATTSSEAILDKDGATLADNNTSSPVLVSVRPRGTPTAGDEKFLRRVRTMEEQVSELKEQVFRTRSRLFLLQESILGGASIGQGAKATIIHRNEMGGAFILESAAYSLDGAPIFSKIDLGSGELDEEEIPLFNGRIQPGQHQVVVQLRFRGHGYGVFKYLDGYKFTVESSHTFSAESGRVTNLKVIAFEQGNFTTDIKDRPAIRYETNLTDDEATLGKNLKEDSEEKLSTSREASPSQAKDDAVTQTAK